jgi:exosortase
MSKVNPDSPSPSKGVAFSYLAIIASWAVLVTQTRHHWGGESYYNFGWFVPLMALWLLWKNLTGLPASSSSIRPLHLFIAIISMILVLPFHALSEVNPFWRLPLWIQACGVAVFCLTVTYGHYGKKGILAALFPLLFASTMIPWPYRMEVAIVQSLTKVVVKFAQDGLHFIGYPVELAGNTFVLGELTIGVSEACSGIRSLQALFMVTLFLGSLFGQGWIRRLAAVLILPVIVIIVNTCRAIFLSIQVIENGDLAYEEWHDPAGYIAFGVSMVLIYVCIELFNIGVSRMRSTTEVSASTLLKTFIPEKPFNRIALTMALLPIGMYVLVEGWFQFHELRQEDGLAWQLTLPEESEGSYESVPISSRVQELLGYSYGMRYQKTLSRYKWADMYYYGYTPDNKFSSVSSYGHSPSICMQATGATMEEQYADVSIPIEGGPVLNLKHYLFILRDTGTRLHIFWTVWEHRNMSIDPDLLQSLDYRTQWIQLVKGRRDFSRKVLLVSFAGMEDDDEARQLIRDLLKERLQGTSD